MVERRFKYGYTRIGYSPDPFDENVFAHSPGQNHQAVAVEHPDYIHHFFSQYFTL